MSLDLVYDIQAVYRKVLNAMARPGKIENISSQCNKIEYNFNCYKSTNIVLLTLLDAEVSFCFNNNINLDDVEMINQITYSKSKSADEADFIIITKDCDDIYEIMNKAKIGELRNPHRSATVIIEVDEMNNNEGIVLVGPGIKTTQKLKISNYDLWKEIREKKNKEFPLGIDIILTDEKGNIACIPRTTKEKEDWIWDM